MKSKNVKVIDEHNIDRDANIMFAIELDGSEYVVYWITRDEESNNVFVSKVLKNIDSTYNMLNIDDSDKKKDVAEIVKALISNSVSDQNDKLVGTGVTLSNGKVAKIISVLFNKEQQINVTKTYITTVKKEVTRVAENYYNIIDDEKVIEVLPAVAPVVETSPVSVVAPVVETPVASVEEPVEAVMPTIPVVETAPVIEKTEVVTSVADNEVVSQPDPIVADSIVVEQPTIIPEPVPVTPIVEAVPVSENAAVIETPVPSLEQSSLETTSTIPAVETVPVVEKTEVLSPEPDNVVMPQPVASVPPIVEVPTAPAVEATPVNNIKSEPLVFNATKETNLNAALGEVASSTNIPVENIESVREFGVETSEPTPVIAPVEKIETTNVPTNMSQKAGFANSKFFMVVAVAFFLASCVFLGYEVYNYFQLVK